MVLDVYLHHDIGTAEAALAGREDIEAFLRSQANELKDEAYDLIRRLDAVNKRKPPLLLSVRNTSQAFGFRVVWVEMSSFKREVQGRQQRFTKEVTGRKDLKYPPRVFRVYEEPLRGHLWDIEQRAVRLRRRVSFWRSTFTQMDYLVAHGGDVAP